MIRPYDTRDFGDCQWLNQISYIRPCSDNELRAKLENPSWVYHGSSVADGPVVIGCLITYADCGRIYVWSVAVAPSWRRKGIAGKLLAEAEKHFPELYLHTEPFSAGYKLYQKRGYLPEKIEPDFYGPGNPAVLMVKHG